ncbi:hypothetical protein BKA83DRAFT_4126019 [Pisolithus microcarpus]|nr:hypothetical protein BKA83DRAFT_4126019 [Pisolithus microcarpus]
MPTLSSSMQYSMQYYAEHALDGETWLMIVQGGRNNFQECLNLAVKEYETSGIHTKVDELIQKAFENHGKNVDDLCPHLVHIVQEYQLCKTVLTSSTAIDKDLL